MGASPRASGATTDHGAGPPAARAGVDELTTSVRTRIIRGDLAPGRRLTEEWLASELGVSRIPIREALRVLASEGFIVSQGYRGTFVASLDTRGAQDLLDVRAVLEPLAAAQAALRRTAEQLDRFHQIVRDGDRARRERRYDDVRSLKGQFFEHLASASHNQTIIASMWILRFKIEWALSVHAIESNEGTTRRGREILVSMIDAITRRDPSRAATAAAAHIQESYSSHGWQHAINVHYELTTPVA